MLHSCFWQMLLILDQDFLQMDFYMLTIGKSTKEYNIHKAKVVYDVLCAVSTFTFSFTRLGYGITYTEWERKNKGWSKTETEGDP